MRTWITLSAVALWAATSFAGPTGTQLRGTKTSSAIVNQTYSWNITKSPLNQSVSIPIGMTSPVSFSITATRSATPVTSPATVSGTITLINTGTQSTIDLYLQDQLEQLIGGNWVVIAGPITIPTGGELAGGASQNYPYSFSGLILDPAQHYRNHAIATIDNWAGFEGTAHSLDFYADPVQVTGVIRDASANLLDTFTCPTGFTCTPSSLPGVVTGTTTVPYTVTITNNTQCCGKSFNTTNVARLDPINTHVSVPPATANVTITTGQCPANFCFDSTFSPAAPYTVFGLVNTSMDLSKTTITGNLGIALGGSANLGMPTLVTGTAYVNTGATLTGNGTIQGGILLNQDLSSAVTAAQTTSSNAAALSPTQSFTTWNTTTTITGNGGVNVINVGSVALGGSSVVTLNGGALDSFIINVQGAFSMTGTSAILAGPGVQPYQILINFVGNTPSTVSADLKTVIDGILLAPQRSGIFDGTINGNLIFGGATLTLQSGLKVNAVCTGTPPCNPVSSLRCSQVELERELGRPLE